MGLCSLPSNSRQLQKDCMQQSTQVCYSNPDRFARCNESTVYPSKKHLRLSLIDLLLMLKLTQNKFAGLEEGLSLDL
ncbi:hypothetical protein AVEN_233395-1, partial [Araneus ventricosus]